MSINQMHGRHHFEPGERGQALIIIVFAIIGLIGMTALAIDGGNAYQDYRKAQTAADAAALTAAITRIEGGDWRAAAIESATANGYDNNGATNTVELNTPPMDGPYADNPEYIQVIVTSHLATYFAPVLGIRELTIRAEAISQSKPAVFGEMFDGYALVSLAPHSQCDVHKSFWIHSEATVSLEGGGVFVNSDNPSCAFISFGSGSVRILDDSPFTIVGGASIQKPQLITPYPPQTGGIPISYPPAFQMPKIGCGSNIAAVDEYTMIMSPGNWDDDFPPEGVHELDAGIYCIRGDVVIGGGQRLIGNGVVLVIEQGSVRFSGDAEIQLSAPKRGPARGLLIYMPLDNHGILALNGNADSGFTGTILAPSADIRINGMESRSGFHSQIIGYYIEVDGRDDVRITYEDDENYDSYKMPEVLLSQ